MSRSSRSPSIPAKCLAQPHPATEHRSPWEPLSSPAWELVPGPPPFSSLRHSYASHGSWQYEDFGRQPGGSGRLHARCWKRTFALLPGTRQSSEWGCEKSPQQSKHPSQHFCFVQSRNTFAQSLCIKSSSLYICQKAQISTHCLPCTNGLQYLPLCLISLFIYLFFLHFLIPLLRWQDTKICLSKFFVCCGSPAVASW